MINKAAITYRELLDWGASFLKRYDIEEAVARWLLFERLGWTLTDFVRQSEQVVETGVRQQFEQDIKQAATHYPPQYIVGHEWFMDYPFKVTEATLIPRPETEAWFSQYVEQLPDRSLTVVDVGTGSGVLAICHKLARPQDTVWAVDISEAALAVARENATHLGTEIQFLCGDLLKPFIESNEDREIDLIVSNPPYIGAEEWDDMDQSVREFEPKLALFAANQGLALYRQLAKQAAQLLSESGQLIVEIGFRQGEAVQKIMQTSFPHRIVNIGQDFNGLDRLVHVK
ncbi:peptide chain release factor N(5)-glutamine methyltransferase [Dolosigranulum savutiense]|uniref:Release factor glutamine methyltransferase n=1 Tax=Dolosigranulum savutiense TaxID=3110288 RepID=A0AB74TRZ0_9LACT